MKKNRLTRMFFLSIIMIFIISIGLDWSMDLHWLTIPFWLFIVAWLIGLGIFHWKSRPVSSKDKNIIRSTNKKIIEVNEPILVTLELSSPKIQYTNFEDKDIVILLDHSGSMGEGLGSPLQESIDAIRDFVKPLPDSYCVSLIMFDHEVLTLCPLSEPRATIKALQSVTSGGQTNIHLALDKAKEQIDCYGRENIDKVVILLSDGFSEKSKALAAADKIKKDNIRIICIGIDGSADVELLKKIVTEEKYYLSSDSKDLGELFKNLYSYISNSSAAICKVQESPNIPEPFKW